VIVYLADLAHDYLPARQFVPLGIGYLASYSHSIFGDKVKYQLFKSVDELLDACDGCKPDLVGFANYTWNERLNAFAGFKLRQSYPNLSIVMGGPNIATDEKGVEDFLRKYSFVDIYCMYGSELAFSKIIECLLEGTSKSNLLKTLCSNPSFCGYSICEGKLIGSANYKVDKDLDFIPSPYLTGTLDTFLEKGFIPIMETNRGCPFACTFCVWGVSALSKIQVFSMDRVKVDLDYVTKFGSKYPQLVFADANFGILKRDVDIAKHIRKVWEDTGTFASIEVYWSKSAQEYMVEIGRVLGHLTNTYIAFQSLDDNVLESIKRKNISTERLVSLISKLKEFTHTTRTDILVGLPGESFESHLKSIDQALNYGINDILGGEIQLLPGSEMETQESREKYCLETKYRFFEGCSGIYRGELVYELQEVVRSTNTMTEEEMIRLRAIRSLFFGGLTLGDHRPLVSYLVNKGVRITELYTNLVLRGSDHPVLAKTFGWLNNQISSEWFETIDKVEEFIKNSENIEGFFGDEAFVKLNYAFTAYLLVNPKENEAYYKQLEFEVSNLLPDEPRSIIHEITRLCYERNFIFRCLNGHLASTTSIEISPPTIKALFESGYLPKNFLDSNSKYINFNLENLTAEGILKELESFDRKPSIFNLTQIMQMYRGRYQLNPMVALSCQDESESISKKRFTKSRVPIENHVNSSVI